MSAAPISADTGAKARALMIERFAAMTVSEPTLVAEGLNEMCTTLAPSGIRAQHGDRSIPRDVYDAQRRLLVDFERAST